MAPVIINYGTRDMAAVPWLGHFQSTRATWKESSNNSIYWKKWITLVLVFHMNFVPYKSVSGLQQMSAACDRAASRLSAHALNLALIRWLHSMYRLFTHSDFRWRISTRINCVQQVISRTILNCTFVEMDMSIEQTFRRSEPRLYYIFETKKIWCTRHNFTPDYYIIA